MALKKTIYAQDLLLSLASTLPRNLIIEGTEENISFVLRLNKTQLRSLCDEAKKKDEHKPLYLRLFTNSTNSPCSFEEIAWDKVKKIEFSADDEHTPDEHQYISVILITKS